VTIEESQKLNKYLATLRQTSSLFRYNADSTECRIEVLTHYKLYCRLRDGRWLWEAYGPHVSTQDQTPSGENVHFWKTVEAGVTFCWKCKQCQS
jgi:hypothetical protein